MESMKSFKGYGKVDELEEQAFRQKARRRIIFLAVAVVVLLLAIVGAVAGTIIHHRNSKNDSYISIPATELTPSSSLRAVCSITRYPDACFSSISSLESTNTTDPEKLFKLSLQVALREITGFADYVNQTAVRANDARTKAAMEICSSVIDDAASSLNESIALMDVTSDEQLLSANTIDDMKTWLSATITNLDTCLDTLEEMNSTLVDSFQSKMENATELASNSLAIVTKILGLLSNFNIPIHRKLLADFPEWVDPTKRRLLAEVRPTPNVTVAADGSGDCLTIHEAVALVPKKGESMFLIYLKAGTYKENVVMEKNKWNVMIYGDGATKSIISGNLNFVDGTPTFATATFAVAAKGFIARDIKFENTAGASKHQAVAFRSGSDMSVIYRCSFDAFQDTLYPHSNRQFYRDCDVTGTIDFIFGNAAVVFQNCNIMPRQPLLNQFNTITAQGKKDPNQNTGISIQKCTISAFDNLTALTYLGRPWKEYSTTVIMQSTIGSFLDPKGWREWVSGVEPPTTIVYGEYLNTGPGAGTDHRVTWRGYKAALMSSEAARFTVGALIQGSSWLPQTSVTFDSAL